MSNGTTTAVPVTSSVAVSPTTVLPISITTTSIVDTTTPDATTPTQAAPETTTTPPAAAVTTNIVETTVTSSGAGQGTTTYLVTVTSSLSTDVQQAATQVPTTQALATSSVSQQTTALPTSSAVASGSGSSGGSGLGSTSKVVVAVVVPIIGVALVAIALIFLWKRRQKNRADEEARRKEVEEYGYNPNNDPHGAVPVGVNRSSSNGEDAPYEMAESDGSGYRGWGTTNGGRKVGMGSNMASSVGTSAPLSPIGNSYPPGNAGPDGYTGVATSPTSTGFPATAPSSDGNSNSPLINGARPGTDDSSIVGAMAGPSTSENTSGIHRGISNASSNYSAMTHSDQSDVGQPLSHHDAQYYGADAGYDDGYYLPYSGHPSQQYPENGYAVSPPVIRDVQARRNTRIETPTGAHFPQQGNSGIAQNF
ncbi:hypothetical protein RUND412_000436 [Rhizina undulata]